MITIYVDSEEEKERLLMESEYIHDFAERVECYSKNGKKQVKWIGLDSNMAGTLMHLYVAPQIIIVRENKK